jgi:BlaI family penicillinase repressor
MTHIPKITETEWEVMRVVWAKHPITAAQVIEKLSRSDSTWHPKTARTLFARLVRRKALAFESQGRAYAYKPLVTERECIAAVSESFVQRVLGGTLTPLLAHFVQTRRLSKKELEELRSLLEINGKKGGK